jgi:hypothetical protein
VICLADGTSRQSGQLEKNFADGLKPLETTFQNANHIGIIGDYQSRIIKPLQTLAIKFLKKWHFKKNIFSLKSLVFMRLK